MTQVDRAFFDISFVERSLSNASSIEALRYWREQDNALDDADRLDDLGRLPSGWWLLPAMILGLAGWALIFSLIL